LGAGGRWFESSRPDHFSNSGVPPGFHLSRDVERHAAAAEGTVVALAGQLG
jgi:hypothetical protein